jgi:hypothetical protein
MPVPTSYHGSQTILSRRVKSGQPVFALDRALLPDRFLSLQVALELRPPASRPALEHVGVVEEAVEHGPDSGGVAEYLPPVLQGGLDVISVEARS